jgi:hypothetical protein
VTRLKHAVVLAAGLVALTTLGTFVNPRRVSAQLTPTSPIVPVKVTNTPLPVTAQGTIAVSGPVQAQQSGPWTVGLTPGTSVGLAPGTTVGFTPGTAVNATLTGGTVSIGNPTTDPVAVRDVDRSGDPFQVTAFLNFQPGELNAVVSDLGIPAGKRLVVEHVSAFFSLPAGQTLVVASISGIALHGGSLLRGQDVFVPVQTAPTVFLEQHQTLLYIDGGFSVGVSAVRSLPDQGGGGAISVIGHLTPAQ